MENLRKDIEVEFNDEGEVWRKVWHDEVGRKCVQYLGPRPPKRIREIIDLAKSGLARKLTDEDIERLKQHARDIGLMP